MLIEGKYNLTLKSQLGPKKGILVLIETENEIFATFTFLGHENILTGRRTEEKIEIDGEIMTPVGLYACRLLGYSSNNGIFGEIIINGRTYEAIGKREGTEKLEG